MRSQRPFSGVESLLNSRSFTTVSVCQQWMQEYLAHIGKRPKCSFSANNIQVGEIVVFNPITAARREWKVQCIEQMYPGPDRLQ